MTDTLQAAKNDLKQGWKTPDGATCKCCGQKVKLYRRRIYAAPARALISLYRKDSNTRAFYHITDLDVDLGGSDFSKLKYWGLIEKAPNDDPDKASSGLWAITEKGRSFVNNKIKLHKYALVYNDYLVAFEGIECGIKDALGKKFDYAELMGRLL